MLTVLFATRDRAEILRQMLEALCVLQAPPGGWQLVVVDNGSTDATPAVLAQFAPRLPLTVAHEPAAGKTRALNRGLAHVAGELVVLTDDDIIPDPDWLVRLHAAAAAEPEASIFGGTLVPRWPAPPPAFISEWSVDFEMLFGQNLRPTGWCPPEVIFGGNMVVRASVFRDGAGFAEDVGPSRAQPSYAMGSDMDFMRRLARAGHRAFFVAEARVQHMIRPDQLSEGWILRRYYAYGLGISRFGWVRGPLPRAKRLFWAACAPLARRAPPSQLRLRILSRERLFAGAFALRR